MTDSADLLQGTLELLILKALSLEPMHGWGISERIRDMASADIHVPQGSLYPAFQRMLRRGLIKSEWRTTANSRRARYYLITPNGRRQLGVEVAAWRRASGAVNAILAFEPGKS